MLDRVFDGARRSARQLALAGPAPTAGCTSSPSCSCGIRDACPAALQTIAFDANDPMHRPVPPDAAAGGCCCRAAASRRSPAPCRPPGRVSPTRVDDVLRSSPTLQANAAQILVDPRLRIVRYTAAARSFDNLGWYLGTSGVGLLYLQDGAALPERLPFGLRSPVVGAVFGAGPTACGWPPTARRWPRRRSPSSSDDLHGVSQPAGTARIGASVHARSGSSRGRAPRSGPRPTTASRGSRRTTGSVDLLDEARGLPGQPGVRGASRARDGSPSAPRAGRRAGGRLAPGRARRPALRRPRARGLPRRRLGVGGHRSAACCSPCPGEEDLVRPAALAVAVAAGAGRRARLAGRHGGGAHARPAPLARPAHAEPGRSAPI